MKKRILTSKIILTLLLAVLSFNFAEAQALAGNVTYGGTSCTNTNDGTLTASGTGGTGNYTYLWSNGATTSTITNLAPGNYTITINDGINSVNYQTFVYEPFFKIIPDDTTVCEGTTIYFQGTGASVLNATLVSDTWTFNGIDTNIIQPIVINTISTMIYSAQYSNGCLIHDTTVITVTPSTNPPVSIGPDQYLCAGTTTSINATGAVSYNWTVSPSASYTSPSQSQIIITPTTSLTISVIGRDAAGCKGYDTMIVNVFNAPLPVAQIAGHVKPSYCNGPTPNGSITATANFGTAPYLYTWMPGNITATINQNLSAGTYTLLVTDANGCYDTTTFTLQNDPLDSCLVVWPGDANNDLIANNYDIIDIGLYYGQFVTPARDLINQGTNWFGYAALNSGIIKPNGFDLKHNDCNGNGLIESSDTIAVIDNYNFTHPAYKLTSNNISQTNSQSGPPLNITFSSDSTGSSNKASLDISLGDLSYQATNIYGVALTLSIDTTIIAKDSASLDITNSWLAAGSPVFLNNIIENYNNGEIDIALCRTNHISVSGQGSIGTVSLTMKDDISGRPLNTLEKYLKVEITKYKLVDSNGDTSEVVVKNDSIKVAQLVGVKNLDYSNQVSIFPNPAKNIVTFKSLNNTIQKIELYSIDGKIALSEMVLNNTSSTSLSIEKLSLGVYFAKIFTEKGVSTYKLVKQ